MEAGLGNGPWLMGEQYTLADIDLIPFVDRFADFYPDMLNATATPKVSGLARAHARAAGGEGGVGDRRSAGEGGVAVSKRFKTI